MEKKDWTDSIMAIFHEICQIPRPSGHEEQMIAYLQGWAAARNLPVKTDAAGNVLISKPASAGMEGKQTVILQAHMDMVCEKESQVEHDFMTQPIETYVEDGWLKARGTTLGADDGMGIAMALAVLDSDTIEHGPIECLFTVSEEIGLCGAQDLQADMMNGKLLINLDSENEGDIFIGCAGGVLSYITFNFQRESAPAGCIFLRVGVDYLHGGHSGDDIEKGFANANKLLARFLYQESEQMPLYLCSFDGGNRHNAIPRNANAVIAVPFAERERIRVDLNVYQSQVAQEYHATEHRMEFSMSSVDAQDTIIEQSVARNFITSMHAVFNGVFAMSMDIPGLVETSCNLASVRTHEDNIFIVISNRSSVESGKTAVSGTVAAAFRLAGAQVVTTDDYPGWTPNPDSRLLKIASSTYKELFGHDAKIKAIHAGLECGLFLINYPDLDMISIGPTLRGVHSPSEMLELCTVNMVFVHLLAILRNTL